MGIHETATSTGARVFRADEAFKCSAFGFNYARIIDPDNVWKPSGAVRTDIQGLLDGGVLLNRSMMESMIAGIPVTTADKDGRTVEIYTGSVL